MRMKWYGTETQKYIRGLVMMRLRSAAAFLTEKIKDRLSVPFYHSERKKFAPQPDQYAEADKIAIEPKGKPRRKPRSKPKGKEGS